MEAPDERIFRAHIAAPAFQLGVETGRWRLVSVAWPNALVAVRAATRENCPGEFSLRFDLTNYPAAAPTATPWDTATDSMLPAHLRPKGNRVGMAFRSDWLRISLISPLWFAGIRHPGSRVFAAFSEAATAADAGRQFIP